MGRILPRIRGRDQLGQLHGLEYLHSECRKTAALSQETSKRGYGWPNLPFRNQTLTLTWTFPLGEGEDGDDGSEEGEGGALHDRQPANQRQEKIGTEQKSGNRFFQLLRWMFVAESVVILRDPEEFAAEASCLRCRWPTRGQTGNVLAMLISMFPD